MIIVGAYFMLQIDKIDPKGLSFSLLNTLGSIMIFYSLMYNWNLASVLIESFWIMISVYGVYKYYATRSGRK
jgi:hypothetical protein